MARGNSGNLRIANRCYRYLESNGEATVTEMREMLNEDGRYGVTSQQLTNVLRCSPLFKKTGTTMVRYGQQGGVITQRSRTDKGGRVEKSKVVGYSGQETPVGLYGVVPIKEIIEKLKGKQHLVRKRWPKVLKDAMGKEGII